MVTGLAIVTVVLAFLNVCLAYRTFRSQENSETFLGAMKQTLRDIGTVQDRMDAREHRQRQARAREAMSVISNALRRQQHVMDGQWRPNRSALTLKDDPLGPARVCEQELAWIPDCDWKTKCREIFRQVGPTPTEKQRTAQESVLTNGNRGLAPGGQLGLYEACMKAIDQME